jgi:hypothetical protein
MSPEQYDRWKDFALRMARTCFRRRRRPDTAWIVEAVKDVFGSIPEEDIPCLVDWDNSDDYPEGHVWYRRTYKCPCWHCSKVVGFGAGRDPGCPYKCEDGSIYDYADPYALCDTMRDWETGYIREQIWSIANKRERARLKAARRRDDWDTDDKIIEALVERYGNPVSCCIRAGLDMASAPSGGVLGYTVGDLRRMYDGGPIPEWIAKAFWHRPWGDKEGQNTYPIDLNLEPEAAGVWL